MIYFACVKLDRDIMERISNIIRRLSAYPFIDYNLYLDEDNFLIVISDNNISIQLSYDRIRKMNSDLFASKVVNKIVSEVQK